MKKPSVETLQKQPPERIARWLRVSLELLDEQNTTCYQHAKKQIPGLSRCGRCWQCRAFLLLIVARRTTAFRGLRPPSRDL